MFVPGKNCNLLQQLFYFSYREKSTSLEVLFHTIIPLIDATGFEPATSASRTQRSTKLSHAS